VRAVPPVPQSLHELVPQTDGVPGADARGGRRDGTPQRRDDDVEARSVDAMGAGVRQQRYERADTQRSCSGPRF